VTPHQIKLRRASKGDNRLSQCWIYLFNLQLVRKILIYFSNRSGNVVGLGKKTCKIHQNKNIDLQILKTNLHLFKLNICTGLDNFYKVWG